MPRYIFGAELLKALEEVGVIPDGWQRAIIDIEQDDYPRLYLQRVVDDRVLSIIADPELRIAVEGKPDAVILSKLLDEALYIMRGWIVSEEGRELVQEFEARMRRIRGEEVKAP